MKQLFATKNIPVNSKKNQVTLGKKRLHFSLTRQPATGAC
jgi:hypothetical protein